MGVLETPVSVSNLAGRATETGRYPCAEHEKIIAQNPAKNTPTSGAVNHQSQSGEKSAKSRRKIEPIEVPKTPLGNTNAESSTPPCATRVSEQVKFNNTKHERFQVARIARRLICQKGQSENFKYPINYHKTAKCIYTRIGDDVGLVEPSSGADPYFSGIVICGKPFTCPLCAPKIQEQRRFEIARAFDWVYGIHRPDLPEFRCQLHRLKVVMVTFTFPHSRWQKLEDLLKAQATAYTKLRAGNPWARIKKSAGYVGLVRSLEVTHGNNGWHPHTHEAWIVADSADSEVLKQKVAGRWLKICQKVGLASKEPQREAEFLQHAVHVRDNCRSSDYLAKQDDSRHWGADREIAAGAAKQGVEKGLHPFQFLVRCKAGDDKWAPYYIEFIDAMRGKSQLFWTHGLKKQVGLKEVSDEEAADLDVEIEKKYVARLDKYEWHLITKHAAQEEIKSLAKTGGRSAVMGWFEQFDQPANAQETDDVPSKLAVHREDIRKDMDQAVDYRQTLIQFNIYQQRNPNFYEHIDMVNAAGVCATPREAACVVIDMARDRAKTLGE